VARPRAKDRFQEALAAYDSEALNRLLAAYVRQRPELECLFRRYGIRPRAAEEMLEEAILAVLSELQASEVRRIDARLLTLTEQQCIGFVAKREVMARRRD
jgi:hypothetical protein